MSEGYRSYGPTRAVRVRLRHRLRLTDGLVVPSSLAPAHVRGCARTVPTPPLWPWSRWYAGRHGHRPTLRTCTDCTSVDLLRSLSHDSGRSGLRDTSHPTRDQEEPGCADEHPQCPALDRPEQVGSTLAGRSACSPSTSHSSCREIIAVMTSWSAAAQALARASPVGSCPL